jgi:very-short-patch-repair endonuclease
MVRHALPPQAVPQARRLRRGLTDAERKLWGLLRDRRLQGLKFRRQVPIGPYIADFVCQSAKLIVEADGSQHAENKRDAKRDAWLASRRYIVVRFWNHDILRQPRIVLDTICARVGLPW